jgi:hypothetical protein
MFELIQPYFSEAFTALVVGLPTWYIARRKNNADATTTEIDNGAKVVDLYKDALNDLPARYEEKYKHVQEMAHNVEKLFAQKEALLLQEIEYHKKQAALYKKMYDDKVKEFIKYKKEHP